MEVALDRVRLEAVGAGKEADAVWSNSGDLRLHEGIVYVYVR